MVKDGEKEHPRVGRRRSSTHLEDCPHCIGYQLYGKFHPYQPDQEQSNSCEKEISEGATMGQIKVDVDDKPSNKAKSFDMLVRKASIIEAKAAPLIVVSNRLPFVLKKNEDGNLERKASAGGLVTAVAPVVIQCEGMWVGWPGMFLDDPDTPIPESEPDCKAPTAGLKSEQAVAVHADRAQFDSFYNGCCNGTFWPLFHSMPDRATFDEQNWKSYREVNNLFALKTMEAIRRLEKKGYPEGAVPIIWIHDYHLMLMANTIRMMLDAEEIKCKLGFFLHIPFPPWDIFRLFPWNDEVLQGMLGCDLIGFHTEDYCVNFLDCCQRQLGSRLDRREMLIEFGGRTVTVKALPIGIPYERFVQMAKEAPRVVKDEKQKIVLGVDRLDYTKGLVHRIKSFERLLELYPEHLGKVTLLQVAVPSRTDVKEYQMLKEEMDQLVGRINGRFSTPNWSPIRYIFGCVSQEELAAFYRDSSVALVTPLRDGMNLVAKEYVACQVDEPGVLILSPFAGAGGTMQEALLANPYELNEVAHYLNRALIMDNDERELRMHGLRKREEANDVNFWLQSFLRAMGASVRDESLIPHLNPMSVNDFDEALYQHLDDNCKVTLLLDYDGTLAPIAPKPELALLPPETKKVLERLSNMSDVRVAIISGRTLDDIRQKVGIDGITYAGNQGLEILHPDGIKYVHPIPSMYADNIKTLIQELQDKCCKEGAWVENKGILLTYHYRATPKKLRPQLIADAEQLIQDAGFQAMHAHCAIEARPPVEWNQGKACIYILRTLYGLEWQDRIKVIFAGDDEPDEEAFAVLKGIAITFRVAPHGKILKTAASMRLSGPDAVLTMLKWVEKHVGSRAPRSPAGSQRSGSFSSNGSPRTYSFSNDHDTGTFEMGVHEDAAEMEERQFRGRKLSNVLTVGGKKTDFCDRKSKKASNAK